MKNRLFCMLIAGMVLMFGSATWVSASSGDAEYTEADKEYYLSDQLLSFIRPGLEFELIEFEVPSDLRPFATFSLKDPGGLPLDREGVFTPGPVDVRMMLTFIPAGEENKVSYHDRFRDRNGEYTSLGDGVYTYKFTTELPEDWDQDATHTLAVVATRDLREFELGRYYDNDVLNYVPSGSTEPMPRDITATETCNRCHDPLAMHGGRYQEVQVCQQCHLPALVSDESGLSYSFNAVIHRVHSNNEPEAHGEVHYPAILNDCEVCHTGGTPTAEFPMVATPNPASTCDATGVSQVGLAWGDEGQVDIRLNTDDGKLFASSPGAGSAETGKWVMDGLVFVLVDNETGEAIQEVPVYNTVFGCSGAAPGTFRGEAAALHTNWMTRPARAVCGGCHANIDWETGEGHVGGAQEDDSLCDICHQGDSGVEYDRSVAGAHTVDYKSSQLGGVLVDVKDISNTFGGKRPTVVFSLSDKWGPLNPADLNRLRFSMTGPNSDFSFYAQENVLDKLVPVGNNWSFTFDTKIPGDAVGSFSLGVEGRISGVVINPGEDNEFTMSDQIQNFTVPFSVGDPEPVARRMIVDDETCENCHSNLAFHGSNRHNASEYCQTCHRPDATDEAVRLEGTDESIHFKYMIHKLHRGADLENGYVVYGYRNSIHDYGDLHFPGDLSNCETCHVEDTYNLPLPAGALPTFSPSTPLNPMLPITASCLSCHDSDAAAAHADSNTSDLGESCETCHGDGKTYSVERVHAR